MIDHPELLLTGIRIFHPTSFTTILQLSDQTSVDIYLRVQTFWTSHTETIINMELDSPTPISFVA